MSAVVEPKKCAGEKCQKCIQTCPVGAISLDPSTKKAVVDPEVCIGCGACEIVCPNKAIQLK